MNHNSCTCISEQCLTDRQGRSSLEQTKLHACVSFKKDKLDRPDILINLTVIKNVCKP